MRSRSILAWTALMGASLAGCGSGPGGKVEATPTGVDLAPYQGIYVATIQTADLVRAGATGPDSRGGTWTLSIAQTGPDVVRVEPEAFDLHATALANGEITFAPDPTCPTIEGRTKPSRFRIQRTSIGLRFIALAPACKADAAPLILGDWRKG